MTADETPSAWLIPPRATTEWRRLSAALEDIVPACTADPDAWTDGTDPDGPAVQDCRQCRARTVCREYGVAASEHGIWGGVVLGVRSTRLDRYGIGLLADEDCDE